MLLKRLIFFSFEEVGCDDFLVLSLGEGETGNHDLEMS